MELISIYEKHQQREKKFFFFPLVFRLPWICRFFFFYFSAAATAATAATAAVVVVELSHTLNLQLHWLSGF